MSDFVKFIKEKIIHRLNHVFNDKIDNGELHESVVVFKKIQTLFYILLDVLKYRIVQIDEPNYQKVESEKLNFINSESDLILIMGCYYKAFNQDIEETLFHLVNSDYYSDFINISGINLHMMPFVADDKIDMDKLMDDYTEFSDTIKNFACDMLEINTDFTTETLISDANCKETNDAECDEIDMEQVD